MFAKLLKHEWNASWRMQGLLSLAVLGIGILGAVLLRILVACGETIMNSDSILVLLIIMLSFALIFLCFALGIYVFAAQLLLLYRFYKNKFTDEGYLTFTLPANSHQLFLSSFVNIVIWMLIAALSVLTAVLIALLFGTAQDGLINLELLSDIQLLVEEMSAEISYMYGDTFVLPMILLYLLSTLISIPVICMCCITVGAVLAKKHKILTAFGLYYGVSFILGLVSSVLMFVVLIVSATTGEDLFMGNTYLLESLLQLGIAVGGYFLSVHLMRTKLNLP